MLKAPRGGGKAGIDKSYRKGVPIRFGFDYVELRNFYFLVKNKATERSNLVYDMPTLFMIFYKYHIYV